MRRRRKRKFVRYRNKRIRFGRLLAAGLFVIFLVTAAGMAGNLIYGKFGTRIPAKATIADLERHQLLSGEASYYGTKNLPPERPDIWREVSMEKRINWQFPLDTIYSQTAYLYCPQDGDIYLDVNSTQQMYPASMTKVMTAVLAVEMLSDLYEPVTLNPDMFAVLEERHASVAGFSKGETVPAMDLLYGVLLPSGADACVALAEHLAGSEEAFAGLMTEKARSLGMANTNFTNTTGLHDDYHYSTVQDIACLMEYALQNETIRAIVTTRTYQTTPTTAHPEGIRMWSTVLGRLESPEFDGGILLGGKTGYTGEAGQCLVSWAVKNNKEYILVTGGAPGNNRTDPYHIIDAVTIYEQYLVTLKPKLTIERDFKIPGRRS